MYNTILFDLDGTLTDAAPGILNAVIYALSKYGIQVENSAELNPFLGPPLHDSFQQFYGFSEENAMEAVSFYREYFTEKGWAENAVYDGIKELLAELKRLDKTLIVATSKPEPFTNRILNHFQLTPYFDFVAGSNLDGTRSKKDAVIAYALKACNITDLASAVMIGDRKQDIIGAKKTGIKSIGVLYGYGSLEELKGAGADFIVRSPNEIIKTIQG